MIRYMVIKPAMAVADQDTIGELHLLRKYLRGLCIFIFFIWNRLLIGFLY